MSGTVIHQQIREWVAELLRLDTATASPAELARLDDVTKMAETQYVRQLLEPSRVPAAGGLTVWNISAMTCDKTVRGGSFHSKR